MGRWVSSQISVQGQIRLRYFWTCLIFSCGKKLYKSCHVTLSSNKLWHTLFMLFLSFLCIINLDCWRVYAFLCYMFLLNLKYLSLFRNGPFVWVMEQWLGTWLPWWHHLALSLCVIDCSLSNQTKMQTSNRYELNRYMQFCRDSPLPMYIYFFGGVHLLTCTLNFFFLLFIYYYYFFNNVALRTLELTLIYFLC